MTVLNINLPAPKTLPSWLSLPHPVQGQALLELDHVFISKLALLDRYLFGAAYASPAAVHCLDAADIEYASWLPDPGALEMASWATHMRSAQR